jgi:Flp pilus assembly protein TadB
MQEIIGTPEQVGYQLGQLQARGELGPMVWETQLPDRPGEMRVRYLPAEPPVASRAARQPVPAQPSRWRSLAIATGAALGVLAGLILAVVLLVRWLLAHPAALILAVAGVAGVVWLAAKVRGRR